MSRIILDGEEFNTEFVAAVLAIPHQLRHLHNQQGLILDKLNNLEARIMGLETEFAALNTAFADLSTGIDREIQQVLDSIAAGNDAKAVVEDARTKINALTASMQEKVAALASDDTPTA